MSLINVTDVQVRRPVARFVDGFELEISFECRPPGLKPDDVLDWKLTYVGSADDEKYDQELDSVGVGPIKIGKNRFVLETPAPNPALIPQKDLMEVTVLILSGSFRDQEFIRIGYYVVTNYPADQTALIEERTAYLKLIADLQEQHQEKLLQVESQEAELKQTGQIEKDATLPRPLPPKFPPAPEIHIPQLQREILFAEPRITKMTIKWDDKVDEFKMAPEDETKAKAEEATAAAEATVATETVVEDAEEEDDEDEEDGEDEGELDEIPLEDDEEDAEDDDEVEIVEGAESALKRKSSPTENEVQPEPAKRQAA